MHTPHGVHHTSHIKQCPLPPAPVTLHSSSAVARVGGGGGVRDNAEREAGAPGAGGAPVERGEERGVREEGTHKKGISGVKWERCVVRE